MWSDIASVDGLVAQEFQHFYSGGDDGYDKFGLLNHDAEKIIDAEYERIDITSPYWAVAYRLEETDEDDGDFKNYSTDKYLVITEVDIYRLDDGSARLAATLDRDAFLEYSTGSDYINIKDRSGVIVTYDADLKKQEGPSSVYRTPEWSKDVEQFVTYRDNGLYGIMDTDGNIIAKAEYTEVSIYPESGCAVVAYDTSILKITYDPNNAARNCRGTMDYKLHITAVGTGTTTVTVTLKNGVTNSFDITVR